MIFIQHEDMYTNINLQLFMKQGLWQDLPQVPRLREVAALFCSSHGKQSKAHHCFALILRFTCIIITNVYNVRMLLITKQKFKISINKIKNEIINEQ